MSFEECVICIPKAPVFYGIFGGIIFCGVIDFFRELKNLFKRNEKVVEK